jgi:hypothetical protein
VSNKRGERTRNIRYRGNRFFRVNTPIITAPNAEGRGRCSECRRWISTTCGVRRKEM